MEELFRFHITRPAERRDAAGPPVGQANQQATLGGVATTFLSIDNPGGWSKLEDEAFKWIIKKSNWLLSSEFQKFITELQSLLNDLLALPSDKLAPSKWPGDFRSRFEKDAKLPNLNQWKDDLSVLFLALLIVRRGGPARINRLLISLEKPSLNE